MHEKRIELISNELKGILLRLIPEKGLVDTGLGGMKIVRWPISNMTYQCFYEPMIVVMLQGLKHEIIGSEKIIYGENQCLITGIDLPGKSYVTKVSEEKPLLAIALPVDKDIISNLIVQFPLSISESSNIPKSIVVTESDPYILDGFLRLLDLLDKPSQQDLLVPLIINEIHYRILVSPLGDFLRIINMQQTQAKQIANAVDWLKENYCKPMSQHNLAKSINMAPSTFRKYFKQLTTLSPLQYQKNLRLHEAQRLMVMENYTATSASYKVGYESSSQFNREYKRKFGKTPAQNVKDILSI